jgi:ATP-dependent protease ClpP protease subunit
MAKTPDNSNRKEAVGPYSEYLNRGNWTPQALDAERKNQLKRISQLRGDRDILVIAADLMKAVPNISTALDYSDILPVRDQLSVLKGDAVDVILETPGGLAEVAEDIVHLLRAKYTRVGMIIPGWAKSAGTILAMAGDEILMGNGSALGPIDPQIGFTTGKRFSADAFLEGLTKIKEDVQQSGKLNPAYIPILQNISPGEIQNCINARLFSQELVREWLVGYKFKFWEKHSSTGKEVTLEEKRSRAAEIAEALCNHSKWLTHNRSIRKEDLVALRLTITDYSKNTELNDAISRYYTLLKMTFDALNAYKIFETTGTQVIRALAQMVPAQLIQQQPVGPPPGVKTAQVDYKCAHCQHGMKIQINLDRNLPLAAGFTAYPIDTNTIKCPKCGTPNNLLPIRLQIEAQSGKKVVR